jgi:hypothetical protein
MRHCGHFPGLVHNLTILHRPKSTQVRHGAAHRAIPTADVPSRLADATSRPKRWLGVSQSLPKQAAELSTVQRQRQAHQARASEDFDRGEILAALKAYGDRGQVVWCDSLEAARAQAVAAQAAVEGAGFLE